MLISEILPQLQLTDGTARKFSALLLLSASEYHTEKERKVYAGA